MQADTDRADENTHPEVVAYLRQRGFDVLDVKEEAHLHGTAEGNPKLPECRPGRIQTRNRAAAAVRSGQDAKLASRRDSATSDRAGAPFMWSPEPAS